MESPLADSRSPLGDRELVTSTIAQTEVAFALAEQINQAPDEDIEAKIDSLWGDKRAITLIEYHTVIALEARELIRKGLQFNWSLKPLDAIHLATARWFGVAEFHTYDKNLFKYEKMTDLRICEPYTGKPRLGAEFLKKSASDEQPS